MKKHYRIVSAPRFITFIILCTVQILVIIYAIGGICKANAGTDTTGISCTEVMVVPGDTLWSIAGKYYGNSVDRRLAVHEIQNVNHMTDTFLYAGQILRLPDYL